VYGFKIDPQTSVRPKVRDGQRIGTGRTEGSRGKDTALLCDAQGYPRPTYRFIYNLIDSG